MSCGIYVIINEENNKKYVGQSINIENRWKQEKYLVQFLLLHVGLVVEQPH